jgi:hypothetical protein
MNRNILGPLQLSKVLSKTTTILSQPACDLRSDFVSDDGKAAGWTEKFRA